MPWWAPLVRPLVIPLCATVLAGRRGSLCASWDLWGGEHKHYRHSVPGAQTCMEYTVGRPHMGSIVSSKSLMTLLDNSR